MILFLAVIFFVLGLIIGSFLNVVICRLNTARSLGGRSACMSCERKLRWYDLVPLFSFLALKGRCRSCETRISYMYPFVEFITGLVFVLLFIKFSALGGFAFGGQFMIAYLYYALMFCLLIVIAVYDARHKIIPDSLVLFFSLLSFAGLFFFSNDAYSSYPLLNFHIPTMLEFLAGIFTAVPFALFWLVSRGAWMGLGDAKLALGIGWMLGISLSLSALMLAFWSGTIIGIILIVSRKGYGMKSEIPFAPYLVFGTFVTFIFNLHLFPFNF